MALLLKKLFRYHWGILLLSFVYLLLTLTNLTILPIGNDEGIYLDWGMRSLAKPGYLYYSLNDGKTPLLMWFFGVFQKIFDDPLFAGRLVSVFAGLAGLLGLYKIGVTFLDKKTAIFSSLLFVITPIIFFYNRMALMEAGVATAGIWSAYYFLKFQRSNTISDALKTGIMVGIGFFIKTNAAIFLIVFLLIGTIKVFRDKKHDARPIGIMLAAFLGTIIILIINPDFWKTLPLNSRYSHSLGDLVHFPLATWANNLLTNASILLVFVTPVMSALSLFGLYILRKKATAMVIIAVTPLIIETILAKSTSQRYTVSFLPLILLGGGYIISLLEKRKKFLGLFVLVITLVIPLMLVFMQIFNPKAYFSTTQPFSKATEESYVSGSLSGYAVSRVLESIRNLGGENRIFIGIAENAGNPESALQVYLEKEKNIKVGYIEYRYFGDQLSGKECIRDIDGQKLYFVSRSNYLVGLEKLLVLEEKIPVLGSREFIGLYKIRDDCPEDKTLIVRPVLAN